jgi:hypothetical protein
VQKVGATQVKTKAIVAAPRPAAIKMTLRAQKAIMAERQKSNSLQATLDSLVVRAKNIKVGVTVCFR